jgi:membrane protease YdiL (CAAX protease family)
MMDWFGDVKPEQDDMKAVWEKDSSFLHACIAFFVAMLLFVGLRISGGLGAWTPILRKYGEDATDAIATGIIQIIIFLLVPLLVFNFLNRQPMKRTLSAIGFNRPSMRVIGYAFLLGVLCYFFNIFVAYFSTFALVLMGYRFPIGDASFSGITVIMGLLVGVFIIGVLPGVCEEVSNRGVLMRGLMSKLGVWRAVLLSSLIFGLTHMSIIQAFYATVLGIFMALAILATRSLWTGIIIHFCNNAIGQFFGHARSNDWAVANIMERFFELFMADYGFVFFCVFGFLMYYLIVNIIHKFARENYKINEQEYFAVFLKNNPEYVSSKIRQGQTVSLEDMARTVDAYTRGLSKFRAIRFYLEGQRKPQKLSALEKTFVFGMVFLGVVVTGMHLVWGLL